MALNRPSAVGAGPSQPALCPRVGRSKALVSTAAGCPPRGPAASAHIPPDLAHIPASPHPRFCSAKGASWLTFLLVIVMFIFVLLGIQFFGGKFCCLELPDLDRASAECNYRHCPGVPRENFDSFSWAAITVFQVLPCHRAAPGSTLRAGVGVGEGDMAATPLALPRAG